MILSTSLALTTESNLNSLLSVSLVSLQLQNKVSILSKFHEVFLFSVFFNNYKTVAGITAVVYIGTIGKVNSVILSILYQIFILYYIIG